MGEASLFDLAGKKALVTGGAMGIGRACAIALAKAGADIAVVDVNQEVGEKTVKELTDFGINAIYISCDVSDKTQVQSMVAEVVNKFGRLDIAVNNAGLGMGGQDESFAKEDWDKLMSINLTGTWLCAQAEAQQMIQQSPTGGKIINIASMCATISIPGCSGAYDASKAAVVHLTRSLAGQWGRFNINVNSISPSHVTTTYFAHVPLERRQRIRELIPLGHIQRPEDLYGPILFLASAASDYVTGQDMIVDGGHTLSTWSRPLPKREVAPRISPEEELIEMKKDLDSAGLLYDENGFIKSK